MADAALLAFKAAGRSYGEGVARVAALHPVDFSIARGEYVCVAGPSGSGKTTLLNLAGLLDRPTEGEVAFLGRETARLGKEERAGIRRELIGFVFQAANLLPVLTALENVEFALILKGAPRAGREKLALLALERVGLHGLGHRRPHELSGGQRQRAAVARALAAKPSLLIADEPTASLDSETAAGLIALFEDINRSEGVTFLFSSHDQRVISSAGRVLLLRDGRLTDGV